MSKSKVVGLDEFVGNLEQLGKSADGVCKMAVYAGAKVVADQLRSNINALPVYDPKSKTKGKRRGATAVEKAGLIEGMGIASMRKDGDIWDATIGFDGYNADKTEKYPKGKANSMIARAINSGTSWLSKFPFVTRTVSASRGKAEAAMAKTIETEVERRLS